MRSAPLTLISARPTSFGAADLHGYVEADFLGNAPDRSALVCDADAVVRTRRRPFRAKTNMVSVDIRYLLP